MLTGLLSAHSGIRYLILVAGVVAFAYALFAVVTRRPYDRGLRATGAAFAGLLHLQVLVGFVMIVSGRFYPALIGHIFMMLFAAVTAQIPLSVMRRRAPEARTALPHLVAVTISLVLIAGGVMAIGRGLLTSTAF
jgi:heme A synthase